MSVRYTLTHTHIHRILCSISNTHANTPTHPHNYEVPSHCRARSPCRSILVFSLLRSIVNTSSVFLHSQFAWQHNVPSLRWDATLRVCASVYKSLNLCSLNIYGTAMGSA